MYTSRLQKFNIIDRGFNQIDKIRMGNTSMCYQTSKVNNLVREFKLEKLIDNIDIIVNYYNGDFSKVLDKLYKYLKCLNAAFYE